MSPHSAHGGRITTYHEQGRQNSNINNFQNNFRNIHIAHLEATKRMIVFENRSLIFGVFGIDLMLLRFHFAVRQGSNLFQHLLSQFVFY